MHKLGRNDPCHCGSGKKYKKCCFATDEEDNNPYIAMEKAFKYPLESCLINDDWKTSGLATIVVVRKNEKTQKFLFAVFLVDVFCLGLKNAMVRAEATESMIADFIYSYPENFMKMEYEECRGLILGAIDYARNLGFEPHKDLEKAKGFIEYDRPYEVRHTFGKDGKPFYIAGPDDDVEKIMHILK